MSSPCKDCNAAGRTNTRKVSTPGPRCGECARAFKAQSKVKARHAYVERVYKIPGYMYDRLGEWQGWKCYSCRVSDGTRKALAVHHDHATGEVLALLCGPCNVFLDRVLKGSRAAALRMANVCTKAGADLTLAPARLAWARVQDEAGEMQYANPLPTEQLRIPLPRTGDSVQRRG